ncbi:sigma-70 family RNA polymerase sigma factor [Amycolatopsis panacis]|uniref:hypothetical protein n=1 Tax=Amycolatopsis panacis TaxID=2340917 RepID=UPI000E73A65A|nr:hypothetical protein [Amycolatopsis panacis]
MRLESRTVLVPRARCSAEIEDRRLADCARTGDVDAFGELVHRYCGVVFCLIRRRVGDPAEAERRTIEVFCATWRELQHPERPQRRFLAMLSRAVTVNLAQ